MNGVRLFRNVLCRSEKLQQKTIGLLQKQKIKVKNLLISSLISPCVINDRPIPL